MRNTASSTSSGPGLTTGSNKGSFIFSGLDIGYHAPLEVSERSKDPRDRPPRALEVRVKRGDLGRKTRRGFYDYSTDPPTPTAD